MRAALRRSLMMLAVCQPWLLRAQLPPVRHNHDIATFAKAGVIVRPVEGRPFHIRLENRSSRSINLVTLRYAKRYRDGSGRVVYSTAQIPYGTIGDRASGLKNGASRVAGTGGDLLMEFSAARYDDVLFELDSIVFDDRMIVGPDAFDVVQQDRERNRAERMILKGLLSRLDQGKQETVSWLRTVTEDRARVNQSTGIPDFYRWAATSFATGLITMVENVAAEGVAKYAKEALAINSQHVPLHH